MSNTVTFRGKEYPIIDEHVVLGDIRIPYFVGWKEDDYKVDSTVDLNVVRKDAEVYTKIMSEEDYLRMESELIREYGLLVKKIRSAVPEAIADEMITHLRSLRSGFANKISLLY